MNSEKQKVSWEEIRKTDMVDYLSRLGFEPKKIQRKDYWYLSPLRDEKTPSLKLTETKIVGLISASEQVAILSTSPFYITIVPWVNF